MSNLGLYAEITRISKKCGGPVRFLLLVAGGGYVTLRLVESGIKWSYKKIKSKINKFNDSLNDLNGKEIYVANSNYSNDYGLKLDKDEKFYVLEIDEDAVIIAKINDEKNPYVISYSDLVTYSNYEKS